MSEDDVKGKFVVTVMLSTGVTQQHTYEIPAVMGGLLEIRKSVAEAISQAFSQPPHPLLLTNPIGIYNIAHVVGVLTDVQAPEEIRSAYDQTQVESMLFLRALISGHG